MGHAAEALEHAEHTAHAAHGHGDDHGGVDSHASMLSTYIGITMAMLGVLLAFASAKVGGERTELVKTLVEQQHAHAKYQAQDIKHRTAVIHLRQVHSTLATNALELFETGLKKAEEECMTEAQKTPGAAVPVMAAFKSIRTLGQNLLARFIPDKTDMLCLAQTVIRYFGESKAAQLWVDAFDPAIKAHLEAQETYEQAQLMAEVGIVLASIALLLKVRLVWILAMLLGIGSMTTIGNTYFHAGKEIHHAEEKIEEFGTAYRNLRNSNKTTDIDDIMLNDIFTMYGEKQVKQTEISKSLSEKKDSEKKESGTGHEEPKGSGEGHQEHKEPGSEHK